MADEGLCAVQGRRVSADLDAVIDRTRGSADAREGIRVWLDKRPPIFRGI